MKKKKAILGSFSTPPRPTCDFSHHKFFSHCLSVMKTGIWTNGAIINIFSLHIYPYKPSHYTINLMLVRDAEEEEKSPILPSHGNINPNSFLVPSI